MITIVYQIESGFNYARKRFNSKLTIKWNWEQHLVFEMPNTKRMLLTFYWGVKPIAKLGLNIAYISGSKCTVSEGGKWKTRNNTLYYYLIMENIQFNYEVNESRIRLKSSERVVKPIKTDR